MATWGYEGMNARRFEAVVLITPYPMYLGASRVAKLQLLHHLPDAPTLKGACVIVRRVYFSFGTFLPDCQYFVLV